jgi:NACHT domain
MARQTHGGGGRVAGHQEQPTKRGGRPGWVVTVAWLTTAIGVPSVVAVLKWHMFTAHPILAVGLLLSAGLLAGIAALAQELWNGKYKALTIGWISGGLDRRMARFGIRYRQHLLTKLELVDLKGTGVPLFTPELDEVYVEVALAPRDPVKVFPSDLHADLSDLPEVGQRGPISAFLGGQHSRVLAVLGAPGSGKTTLLQHTARELCQRGEGRGIPILLYLRDHGAEILAKPEVTLPELVASTLAPYGLTEPPEWLERQLRSGGCVVMLDGLDEVARKEDRQAVSDWLGVQITRYRENTFVVTSRPLGYQSTPIDRAITLQTQPFTSEQISRFLHAWLQAAKRYSLIDLEQNTNGKAEAAAEAGRLAAQLQGYPALRPLAANPLLLTMIATVHLRCGALPGTRAELYAQICDAMIFGRQAAKKLEIEARGQQRGNIMQVLAFEMMRRKVQDLPSRAVVAVLYPLLSENFADTTAEEFLKDAAADGLFVERGNGDWTFAHKTFQEYLAAAHIKNMNLQKVLIDAVSDAWWHETTLLYVAGSDAGPIVEACLTANSLSALALAFDCAEEAAEFSSELRDRLEALRTAGLAPGADPQRRQLMIGVTVARHLRPVIETSRGTTICRQPITAGVYQFFLEDMAARGNPRPPDARLPAKPVANQIMTGVRGSDAAAFVEWVNTITGGQSAYRLPSLAEVEDSAVRSGVTEHLDPVVQIWLAPDGTESHPQIFSPSGAPPPWVTSSNTIRRELMVDLQGAPQTLSERLIIRWAG